MAHQHRSDRRKTHNKRVVCEIKGAFHHKERACRHLRFLFRTPFRRVPFSVCGLALIHLYVDDLFPKSIGPIFPERTGLDDRNFGSPKL